MIRPSRESAFWASVILVGFGIGLIANPIYLLFKCVLIPHFVAMHAANKFANGYFVWKTVAGILFLMSGLFGLKITSLDAKKKKEYEADFLKAENESLRAKIAELKNAPQKGAQAAKKGHADAGTDAASVVRVAEWKEAYIPAMVKAALELGKNGLKPNAEKLQRKDIGALLDQCAVPGKALPSDCAEAVETFRSSLPDEYLNKVGGAPKSRVTKIKQ